MTSRAAIRLDFLVRALDKERVLREQRSAEFHEKLRDMKERREQLLDRKAKRLRSQGILVDMEKIRKESKVLYLYSYMAPTRSPNEEANAAPGEDIVSENEEDSDCESYQSYGDFTSYRTPDYELYRGVSVEYNLERCASGKLGVIEEDDVIERLKNINLMSKKHEETSTSEQNQGMLSRKESMKSVRQSSKSNIAPSVPLSQSRIRLKRAETKLSSVRAFGGRHLRSNSQRKLMSSNPEVLYSSPEVSPDRGGVTIKGVRNVARAVKAVDHFKDNYKRKSRKTFHKKSSSNNVLNSVQ